MEDMVVVTVHILVIQPAHQVELKIAGVPVILVMQLVERRYVGPQNVVNVIADGRHS